MSQYFSYLPYTTYELQGNVSVVKDIMARSGFISEHHPYTDLYNTYNIKNGESIQSLAKAIYHSVDYYWVIMIINEIHDVQYEWPLDQLDLESYIKNKYGETDMLKTKHWVTIDTNLVVGEVKEYAPGYISPENPGPPNNQEFMPVTFYEYEEQLNDAKRQIYLLKPALLGEFVLQFKKSFQ